MKRREATGRVPAELATFTEAAWPAADVYASYGRWVDAREVWADKHGWPGGDRARWDAEHEVLASLPDAPFDYDAI